ncbi:MAG: hypothetical protein J6Q85_05420 [Clostridia bacterium]|nr:hypothetical protein [Clostridia bacterium]
MKALRFLIITLIFTLLLTACTITPSGDGDDEYETVSISTALSEYGQSKDISEDFYISATVKSIDDASSGSITVSDSTGSLSVTTLVAKGEGDSEISYNDIEEKPVVGSTVTLCVNLSDSPSGVVAWYAILLEVKAPTDNGGEESGMTISEARALPKGSEVTVEGVVARITYSFGLNPSGFILADDTASIYVYDAAAAKSVKEGNRVTISGTRAYWILEDEMANAEKFGYMGSSQIENVTVISNDNKTTGTFDKSWVKETSVKELLEIPVTEDITSKIYKVNALVKEIEGSGYTNFYFFDLDGTTGTYTYTQCNGSDFTWLREFDGKFCTVYITALNAKSTSSDCYFRFLPVAVYDEGYVFDTKDAPEYAVKYHGLTQIKESYTGDPALLLNTSVSSELLGFEGATLSFSSSDESVVKFTVTDDGAVMNCPGFGTATVTVSASYGNYEYSESITVTVKANGDFSYIGVADAINANPDSTITVKGIAGPSFVHANRRGFYLIDEGGIIAVSFKNAKDIVDIEIGNEVILSGVRINVDDTQACINDAELEANFYGQNEIPESLIITDKTLADIKKICEKKDVKDTAKIFAVTASAEFIKSQYSTTCNLKDTNGQSYQLYSSNVLAQYGFLSEITEPTTILVTICDWNGKGHKLCAVGVVDGTETVYNEYSYTAAKS